MKKLLATMLALVCAVGMSITALAVDGAASTPSDPSSTTSSEPEYNYLPADGTATVTITKDYQLTNAGTVSPAETFYFSIERTSVSDAADGVTVVNMPLPTIGNVAYNAGDAGSANAKKNITVALPEYTSVGIYTYTIKEIIPGTADTALKDKKPTAGVTYRTEDITLVITVVEVNGKKVVAAVHCENPVDTSNKNGTKTSEFVNTYSAGNVEITKVVTGNLGDKTKYFDVTITLTLDSTKDYSGVSITANGDELSWKDANNGTNPTSIDLTTTTSATFHIKDGETVEISNIPYGVTYTVTEADYASEGYDKAEYAFTDTDKECTVKTIDSALETVTITNNKTGEVDTGINLDNMPYIVLLGIAAAGMILFLARKRVND